MDDPILYSPTTVITNNNDHKHTFSSVTITTFNMNNLTILCIIATLTIIHVPTVHNSLVEKLQARLRNKYKITRLSEDHFDGRKDILQVKDQGRVKQEIFNNVSGNMILEL